MLDHQAKAECFLGKLLMVKKSSTAAIHGFVRGRFWWSSSEFLFHMDPKRCGKHTYHVHSTASHAQKNHAQPQATLVGAAPAGVNHLTFGTAVSEKIRKFKGTELMWQLSQTQVACVPFCDSDGLGSHNAPQNSEKKQSDQRLTASPYYVVAGFPTVTYCTKNKCLFLLYFWC